MVLFVLSLIHCGIGRFCFCALASFCFVRNDLWDCDPTHQRWPYLECSMIRTGILTAVGDGLGCAGVDSVPW